MRRTEDIRLKASMMAARSDLAQQMTLTVKDERFDDTCCGKEGKDGQAGGDSRTCCGTAGQRGERGSHSSLTRMRGAVGRIQASFSTVVLV
jgi:hypothetical protein